MARAKRFRIQAFSFLVEASGGSLGLVAVGLAIFQHLLLHLIVLFVCTLGPQTELYIIIYSYESIAAQKIKKVPLSFNVAGTLAWRDYVEGRLGLCEMMFQWLVLAYRCLYLIICYLAPVPIFCSVFRRSCSMWYVACGCAGKGKHQLSK